MVPLRGVRAPPVAASSRLLPPAACRRGGAVPGDGRTGHDEDVRRSFGSRSIGGWRSHPSGSPSFRWWSRRLRRGPLVDLRTCGDRLRIPREVVVHDPATGSEQRGVALTEDDEDLRTRDVGQDAGRQRDQGSIDEDDPVTQVVDHVGELVGGEPAAQVVEGAPMQARRRRPRGVPGGSSRLLTVRDRSIIVLVIVLFAVARSPLESPDSRPTRTSRSISGAERRGGGRGGSS